MIPTMVFDESIDFPSAEPPRFLLGTPGSFAIPQTSLQLLVNLLDHAMDVQEAIEAPWALLGEGASPANGDTPQVGVNLEGRIPLEVAEALTARGHEVSMLDEWSRGSGMGAIERRENGALFGGADPRRDCYAIGW